ncbi:type II toxin-antitoxin system VapB family antitoxin [Paracraurococcus ruber]|uniref:Type II toxin-antitoxin system VapB family antitoxin n=1 Tax=Paracraurococcus ruber TaxID=77675 RepID=A0ABS1D1W2_9PROT|nr:type II toxin-antitoxin system VapB family antitoxin [Paracraurococcus ruber]MBK1660498.1 hypothetical protein [Paracraurococcus ruber]TDG27462.1 type II toxin-antitoxin system VapB family antitoxin [Paracraurococcus ruber]
MRTNIDIDDALMAEAMARGGYPTKRAAVEEGLRMIVRLARQREAAEGLWGSDPDWRDPAADLPADLLSGLHGAQAPLR